MIEYFVGGQGSGKSYFAMSIIYREYIQKQELDRKYNECYTNIDGVNTDKYEFINFLELNAFDKKIKDIYDFYRDNLDNPDVKKLTQAYAKENQFYRVFIALDECHNLLAFERAHLVWWITWHRHLYQHVLLITQDLGLLKSKYKIAQSFYRAVPNMLQNPFTKHRNFVYRQYPDKRMTVKAKDIKLPKKQEIFDLYDSGDTVDTKSLILPFLIFSAVLLVGLLVAGYFYLNSMSGDEVKTIQPRKQNTNPINKPKRQKETIKGLELHTAFCNRDTCSFGDTDYPRDVLVGILKEFELKVLKTENVFADFDTIYFLVNADYKKVLVNQNQQDDNYQNAQGDLLGNTITALTSN